MFHKALLVLLLLFMIISMFAQAATLLSGIPPCFAINPKDGVQISWVQPTGISFVYREKVDAITDRIIYAKPVNNSGGCSFTVVETLTYIPETVTDNLRGAPSLALAEGRIVVAYNYLNSIKQAVSTDNGVNWTISEIDTAQDIMPIIKVGNDENTAFITHLDELCQRSYQYFTDEYTSTNNTPVNYNGVDVVIEAVRANSDIWIRQSGGGSNNGWPVFYAPVITSGTIQSFSGTPPLESVFRGGYYENALPLEVDRELMHSQILNNAITIGPTEPDENRIIFVTVNGPVYTALLGTIVQNGLDTLEVYSNYPPGNGDVLYLNIIPHIDTVWTSLAGGSTSNQNMAVKSPLWIRGNFTGKQTWYSPFDIKLVDNITLTNVPMGEEIPETCEDYVALVSDQKIMIQYGYKDPADSLRYKPNCDGDQQGIYIYASLYALSEGASEIPQDDGCFTFEYQHPHGSVPAIYLNGLFDNIDLHRYHYHQGEQYPWPGNIDLPWYNPLWPERYPYLMRGKAHLYGSLYQHKKGYMYRSFEDTEYPNYSSIWTPYLDLCGGPSNVVVNDTVLGIPLMPANAPGASGTGIGYLKDFHSDSRLRADTFGFNPFGLGIRLQSSGENTDWTMDYYKPLNDSLYSKSLRSINPANLQFNNRIFYQSTANSPMLENLPPLNANETIEAWDFFMEILQHNDTGSDTLKVLPYHPETNLFDTGYSVPVAGNLNSSIREMYTPGAISLQPEGQFRIEYLYYDSPIGYVWNPEIPALANQQYNIDKSQITLLKAGYGAGYFLLFLANPDSTGGQLYGNYVSIMEVANEDNTTPPLQVSTRCYPNPFKQSLTLSVKTNQTAKADISVYNIKGQKVRNLAKDHLLSKGEQSFTWDGLDSAGHATASGIYFLRSKIEGRSQVSKLLKVK